MEATNINNRGFAEKNAKVKKGKCKFPFKYKRKTHTKCLSTNLGEICATTLSKHGTLKTYGYCNKKKSTAKKTLKRQLKLKQIKQLPNSNRNPPKEKMTIRRNEELIALLGKLEELMYMKGEPMRARAYSKAQESIMLIPDDITDPSQLKGVPGIGPTIRKKFQEYLDTGTLGLLERSKKNPIYLFAKIHGVGPKKAKELVEKDGITTMEDLRKRKDEVLNNVQLKGLKYFNDIQKRIPRAEIDTFEKKFSKTFDKVKGESGKFEIVGSYRRGAQNSGDIDIIITNDGKDKKLFSNFIEALQKEGIIVDILSKGRIKSMVVARLPGKPVRRVDFMYAPSKEFSFAILYFTGSRAFNVMMRERAKQMGYSLNEHRLIHLANKDEVMISFPTEKSIFDFLQMVYKTPAERKNGRAVEGITPPAQVEEAKIMMKRAPKNKTLKKKKKKKKKLDKRRLELFKTEGVALLKRMTEDNLAGMVNTANILYYNKKAILTDNEFDILKEYMESRYPKNAVLKAIGAPVDKKKQVKLPVFMPSMDKIKADTKHLPKWRQKYKGPYVVSAKADGISGLLVTKKDSQQLYTRGNGIIGWECSYLIPFLDIPTVKGTVIRGEIIMERALFNRKYSKEYKNPRNAVGGIINADFSLKNIEKYKDLDFVAYEVIRPRLKPTEQMTFLEEHQFKTIKYEVHKNITNEELSKTLVDWRNNYKYQNDGLIVADDNIYLRWKKNPKHAFAFKMVLSDQKAEAKVLEVIWTPSKDGFLKPRVRIEPVDIGGVTIEYATAFNAAFVEKNKIGMGALIEMVRSGDVIPHILKVITPARQAQMPTGNYKWNNTHVDIVLDDIKGNQNVQEKVISRFFKHLDVDGLGEGNVKRLMKAGFNTIETIINMKKDDFLQAQGFKEKLAEKVFKSIHEKLDSASLVEIMAATNIFGRGIGRRRLQVILDAYPEIIKGKMSKAEAEEKISHLKGFGDKTANDFSEHLKSFLEFIKATHLEKKLKITKKKVDVKHPLFDKNIVMTGFRDKDLAGRIAAVTGKSLKTAVSKSTFVVLVKDIDEDTGKAEEARTLDIPIMTANKFTQKYLV
jgi:DNA ligase (NAD+)